jgi:hypothetical protein
MILHLKDFKDSTKKLLDVMNIFGNAARYKINTLKSVVFPYANNEQVKKEIKKTISFSIASKNI